jgi:hypothetical protein
MTMAARIAKPRSAVTVLQYKSLSRRAAISLGTKARGTAPADAPIMRNGMLMAKR